jgi:hypothetical protein
MNIIDVILQRRDRPGSRGYQYEVWREVVLLTTSRDPEYATCRRLFDLGERGIVRFWRELKPVHDSSLDIERGAKWAVTEGQKAGPRVCRYSEHWASELEAGEEEALAA